MKIDVLGPGCPKCKKVFENAQKAVGEMNLSAEVVKVEDIQANNPDVVVLATGSLPALPSVDGIDSDIVVTYEDVLNAGTPTYKNVVVIGGGPTGLELALHLAEYGCLVTVVEVLPKIGSGLEAITKKMILKELKANKVELMTSTRLLKIRNRS